MAASTSFPAHLLSIATKNDTGEKEMIALFNLMVSNGGW